MCRPYVPAVCADCAPQLYRLRAAAAPPVCGTGAAAATYRFTATAIFESAVP